MRRLDHLNAPLKTIDLMIADQLMPGMTGLELIAAARRDNPGLMVILASGFTDLPTGAASDLLRLAKPFGQNDLSSAIVSATQRHRASARTSADMSPLT